MTAAAIIVAGVSLVVARIRRWFDSFFADRSLVVVLMLALLIVPTRSAIIASVHGECVDDEYHLVRGVRFLRGELGRTPLNDPVLGASVIALPVWLCGAVPNADQKFGLILRGQSVSADTLQMLVALWKSLLFVPFVGLAFCWARRLYNAAAGWTAAIVLLIEPTIVAHVVPAALDVVGFEMIALACWCWWRYFERPTWRRLVVASVVAPAAMLTKHTAIVVPLVAAIYAVLWWFREPNDATRGRRFAVHGGCAVVIAFVALTILSGGFHVISTPRGTTPQTSWVAWLAQYPLPAGYYWRSIQAALDHGAAGHPAWLLGEPIVRGSWRNWAYYVVVAAYKVPIGLAALLALGAASLAFVRPRFAEWALIVPIVLLTTLIVVGGINIGFRHAIPAYGLLLIFATRALLIDRRAIGAIVAVLLAATTADVARFGPDQLSYINWPRRDVWLAISDSNLDWGQGLKQIRTWIDTNGKRIAGRPIAARLFVLPYSSNVTEILGDRVTRLQRTSPVPTSGLLIVSPTTIVGSYENDPGRYAFLRDRRPVAVIGHSVLVFDLDRKKR